jgi:hypothetical protein
MVDAVIAPGALEPAAEATEAVLAAEGGAHEPGPSRVCPAIPAGEPTP